MTAKTAKRPVKEAYHHGDLRQTLITSTRRLVEEKGAEGFSLAEAARAAGVSTAAPYRHFKDRNALMTAVALDGKARMAAAFAEAAAPHVPGSRAAIAAIGCAYVAFAAEQPGLFRLMFSRIEGHEDEMKEGGERCFDVLLDQLATRLGAEREAPEARQAGFPLWTFVHGAAFLTIDGMMACADGRPEAAQMIEAFTARMLDASDCDG